MNTLEALKAKMLELQSKKVVVQETTTTIVLNAPSPCDAENIQIPDELSNEQQSILDEAAKLNQELIDSKTDVEIQLDNESKQIECECCPNKVNEVDIRKFHSMKMCPSCYDKEIALQAANTTPEAISNRVAVQNQIQHESIERIRMIDSMVQLRQDIFNAETIAINTIKSMIDSDESIPHDKKIFMLGKAVKERIEHFQKVIFDLGEEQVKKNNEMRASITYFNEMQNKLRADEREQLKLADLNYKPQTPKLVTPKDKPSNRKKPAKLKFKPEELREQAAKLAIYCMENKFKVMTLDVIHTVAVSRNLSAIEAVELIKTTPGFLTKSE